MKSSKFAVFSALVLLLSMFTTAPASATAVPAVNPATTARVRIVHAAPDAPNVDVYVDAKKKLANVPFFTAGEYLSIAAGTRLVQVTPTGAPASSAVISGNLTLAPSTSYTLAAIGELATGSPFPLQPKLITETLDPFPSGQATVRVYHFSPGAPDVGVRIQGGATLIARIGYPNASTTITVAAGTYNLEVFAADTPSVVAATLPNTVIEANKLYNLFAVGKLSFGALNTFRVETRSADATAKVRVVHASPNAPNVDVYVGEDKVLSNIPYFTISDYLTLPVGTYRFRVTPAGQPLSAAVLDQTATVAVGRFYTIAAVGTLLTTRVAALQVKLIEDDLATPAPGTARVRVHHFASDAPAVGVRLKGGQVLINNLSFPNVSDDLELPAGTYDLEVFLSATGATALALDGVRLDQGRIYDLFVIGLVQNNTLAVVPKIYGPNGTAAYRVLLPLVLQLPAPAEAAR